MKRKIILGGILGLLVVIILAFSPDEEESVEQLVPSETHKDNSKRKPHSEAKSVHRMGKPFKLGNFAYVVQSIEPKDVIGKNRYARTRASEGGVFLVVEYTIENLGKETETVLSDDFKMIDKQGRSFRPSTEANTALMMSGEGKDFLFSEIQPGLKRKMQTAFEVPVKSANSGLRLIIPEKGVLGSGKAEIAFSFQKEK